MEQWSSTIFHKLNEQANEGNKTTTVELDGIHVSSGDVWNGLIFEISETVEENGLKELRFKSITGMGDGEIEPWPMTLLEPKSINLEKFEISLM